MTRLAPMAILANHGRAVRLLVAIGRTVVLLAVVIVASEAVFRLAEAIGVAPEPPAQEMDPTLVWKNRPGRDRRVEEGAHRLDGLGHRTPGTEGGARQIAIIGGGAAYQLATLSGPSPSDTPPTSRRLEAAWSLEPGDRRPDRPVPGLQTPDSGLQSPPGRPVAVRNAAVPGHTTFLALAVLSWRLVFERPDTIVAMCGFEDAALLGEMVGSGRPDDRNVTRHWQSLRESMHLYYELPPAIAARGLVERLAIGRAVLRLAGALPLQVERAGEPWTVGAVEYADAVVGTFAANVRSIVAVTRVSGALPVLVLQPLASRIRARRALRRQETGVPRGAPATDRIAVEASPWSAATRRAIEDYFAAFDRVLAAMASELDVDYVDASALLAEDGAMGPLLADDVRLTARGGEALAAAMRGWLGRRVGVDSDRGDHGRGGQ